MLRALLLLLLASGSAKAQIQSIGFFPGGQDGQVQFSSAGAFEGIPGSAVKGSTLILAEVRASSASFGIYPRVSTFSYVGGLDMAPNATILLHGSTGYITSESSITASAFFGNGSALTGIPSSGSVAGKVALAGDVMSGPLTTSSLTVTGRLQASSGVFTNGGTFSNPGYVFISSGSGIFQSTSSDSGAHILRIYNSTGNPILEFNQGRSDDLQQVFRIYNSAQASILTIQGTGGITTSAGISSAGNILNTGTGQVNFNSTGGNSFKSQLTIVKSSLTIVDSGIYAASGTFTNGITASSGSFTQTSTYSIVSSSGLFLRAGTIDLSMKPDIGIRYYDGSVSTTAALPTAAASVAASSIAWQFIDGAPTFTNTSFGGCLANTLAGGTTVSINVAAGDKGVRISYSMSMYGDSGSSYVSVNVIRDQVNFQSPADSNSGWSTKLQAVVNDNGSQPGVVFFPELSAGVHTFCLAAAVSAGTGVLNCNADSGGLEATGCYIYGEAVP